MRIALIGTGNMGSACAEAARRAMPEAELLLVNRTKARAEALAARLGGAVTVTDARTAAEEAELLFLGIKPQMLEAVAQEIGDVTARREGLLLVSMAAGVTLERLGALFGRDLPTVRMMPNLPMTVGEGMTLWCANDRVTDAEKQVFCRVLASSGHLGELSEGLIDAGSAVSGCGPAFVCLFLEAMADGGVACGLTRAQATEYAVQTLLGTAKQLAECGTHPAALKDAVCSPGGSTIEGVRALEGGAFRSTVMRAVSAAFEKTRKLGR